MPVAGVGKLESSKSYGLHAVQWLCFQYLLQRITDVFSGRHMHRLGNKN